MKKFRRAIGWEYSKNALLIWYYTDDVSGPVQLYPLTYTIEDAARFYADSHRYIYLNFTDFGAGFGSVQFARPAIKFQILQPRGEIFVRYPV